MALQISQTSIAASTEPVAVALLCHLDAATATAAAAANRYFLQSRLVVTTDIMADRLKSLQVSYASTFAICFIIISLSL